MPPLALLTRSLSPPPSTPVNIDYKGNYDNFEKTRAERRLQQQREYESLEAKKKHIQCVDIRR